MTGQFRQDVNWDFFLVNLTREQFCHNNLLKTFKLILTQNKKVTREADVYLESDSFIIKKVKRFVINLIDTTA